MIATKQTIRNRTSIYYILALLGGLALLNPSCVKKTKSTNLIDSEIGEIAISDDTNNEPSSVSISEHTCRKPGGGNCIGNEDCEERCDRLFGEGKNKDACLKLSVDEVEGMYVAFNDGIRGGITGFLEDPEINYGDDLPAGVALICHQNDKNLYNDGHGGTTSFCHPPPKKYDEEDFTSVCHEDVKNLLIIDKKSWSRLISDYNSRNAEDVLFWLAENELIFENGIKEVLGDDESQDLIKSILYKFKPKDANLNNRGIPAALREELGDDPDPEDTFLSLTNSNKLKELTNNILLENCLSDTPNSDTIYNTVANKPIAGADADQKNAACALGEVYCIKDDDDDDDYIFEFTDILSVVDDPIKSFIKNESPGLNFKFNVNGLSNKLADVCPVFCAKWPADGANAITDNARPKACPIPTTPY